MLSPIKFDETVWKLNARDRLIYEVVLLTQIIGAALMSLALIGGLSAWIARLLDPDMTTDSVVAAVIAPAYTIFALVWAALRRHDGYGDSLRLEVRRAARAGFMTGMRLAFGLLLVWYFLGQVIDARRIHGQSHFMEYPGTYCSPDAVFYALVFAVPIALGCSLLTIVYRVAPHLTLNWVQRPDNS